MCKGVQVFKTVKQHTKKQERKCTLVPNWLTGKNVSASIV